MGFLTGWFSVSEPELEENEIAKCIEYIEQLQKQLDGFWQELLSLEIEVTKFNMIVNFYSSMQETAAIEQEYLSSKIISGMFKNIAKSLDNTKKTLLDRRAKLYKKYCETYDETAKTYAYLYSLI